MKKFKRMVYSNHFSRDYVELEQKKKSVETKIALALKKNDFEGAKVLIDDLEVLIKML
jgi:ATP-binding cassette subfamily F protein 3